MMPKPQTLVCFSIVSTHHGAFLYNSCSFVNPGKSKQIAANVGGKQSEIYG